MKAINTIKQEWNNVTKLHLFEIEVTNKATDEVYYIVFDIELRGRSFYASHVALTTREQKSKKIAYKTVKIDPDFSLEQNLTSLYEKCTDAICDSDFYTLSENN